MAGDRTDPDKPGSPIDPVFALALTHHQRGQIAEAETLYRQVLAANPRHAEALHFSGVAALQQSRLETAAELIERSLALREDDAQAHYHLGLVMGGLQRFEQAAAHNRRALALKPDMLDAHTNLGNALKALGRLDEAKACYEHVVATNPKLAAAHYNLANLLVDQREMDAAIAAFERAHAADPNHLSARQNLGTTLLTLGRLDEAIEQFKRVVAANWNATEAKIGHAFALLQKGQSQAALSILCRVLDAKPTADAKLFFVACIRSLAIYTPTDGLEKHLIAALTEPWDRPRELSVFVNTAMRTSGAVAAVRARAAAGGENYLPSPSDLAALASDRLLLAVLENASIADDGLEHLLTAARGALLAMATGNGVAGDALLGFASALARQCFVNEYVFSFGDDEREQVQALRGRISTGDASPLTVAVVASYVPLHDVAGADSLLARTWPAAVEALLTQQLREPRRERELREAVPHITTIDDDISRKVQQQYEENPYPRWVKIARIAKAVPFDDFLRKLLPLAPLQRTGKSECDILVAGCGTGQQSIETALTISNAKVLAIDLSRASLAHAQRKTRELGIATVDYAQADILKLPSLGRSFDYIVSTGVLHHMADPFAAWRNLLTMLRPSGVMIVGLYSEIARQHIVAAREFISERRFQATPEGIRSARRAILSLPDGELVRKVTSAFDFFSMSECRDLLFHVQELRLTIPQLKSFIDATGLRFLGFNVHPEIVGRYRARFPDNSSQTDLDNWQVFETEYPQTFISMYQFFVQKPSGEGA